MWGGQGGVKGLRVGLNKPKLTLVGLKKGWGAWGYKGWAIGQGIKLIHHLIN